MCSRIHGSSHGTHRLGGLFRMEDGETSTGIRLHGPRARLQAPLEPQQRQAVDWNHRFQHCAGLVRKSARPFHLTILTASGVARSPAPALLERLERSLKKSLSSTPGLVAGDPDPILDPPTDLPHRVIATLHVRSVLHTQLFSARNVCVQHVACGRPDHRTSFHLSIHYFVMWQPVALPGPTF